MATPALNRRQLSRDLTEASRAPARAGLDTPRPNDDAGAYRIGFTGPPGAGKSSLIARLAGARITSGARIGVLAIDPTSPLSGGSILGDRIRMDDIADNANLFIRSVASRWASDGLASNVVEMMRVMDRHDFDEVYLETVGIGQIDHAVKALVDTVVLVLVPESGDSVQAMKAGILEMADVYVINKSDRPNAQRIAGEIEGVVGLSSRHRGGWTPEILLTSAANNDLAELDQALHRHRDWLALHHDRHAEQRRRARHQVQSLLSTAIAEINAAAPDELFDRPLREVHDYFLRRLRGEG